MAFTYSFLLNLMYYLAYISVYIITMQSIIFLPMGKKCLLYLSLPNSQLQKLEVNADLIICSWKSVHLQAMYEFSIAKVAGVDLQSNMDTSWNEFQGRYEGNLRSSYLTDLQILLSFIFLS